MVVLCTRAGSIPQEFEFSRGGNQGAGGNQDGLYPKLLWGELLTLLPGGGDFLVTATGADLPHLRCAGVEPMGRLPLSPNLGQKPKLGGVRILTDTSLISIF